MERTKTFVLDWLHASDAETLHTLMVSNKDRFIRFFSKTLSKNMSLQASKAYILLQHAQLQLASEFTFAIREASSRKVGGLIIIREINREKQQGEISYCIGEEFQGKGWVTAALIEVSAFATKELKLETLRLIIHKSNIASLRVAKKANYIWQKTLKEHYTPPNEAILDMELFTFQK